MKVSLKNLVNRIETDEKLLEKNPQNKEILQNRITKSKELIIKCVLQNSNNILLEDIIMK